MKLIEFKNKYFNEFNIWYANIGPNLASNVRQVELKNAKYIYDVSSEYPEEFDITIINIMSIFIRELFLKRDKE